MNTCYNALDRHVESGHGEQLALIYDSPVTNTIEKYTYKELKEQVYLESIVFGSRHKIFNIRATYMNKDKYNR